MEIAASNYRYREFQQKYGKGSSAINRYERLEGSTQMIRNRRNDAYPISYEDVEYYDESQLPPVIVVEGDTDSAFGDIGTNDVVFEVRFKKPKETNFTKMDHSFDGLTAEDIRNLAIKFFEYTAMNIETDCLEWVGSVSSSCNNIQRYGKLCYKGKYYYAHRLAWFLKHGEIPKGKLLLHKCDNKRCCRVEHLFLGDHKDNVRDAIDKGIFHKGERTGNSKLTEQKVIEILLDTAPAKEIALKHNICLSNIYKIKNREIWSHVEVPTGMDQLDCKSEK